MSTGEVQAGTVAVTLDHSERAELLPMLESALGEARVEVHRTHTPDFRAQVQHREELLRRMIEKLRHAGA